MNVQELITNCIKGEVKCGKKSILKEKKHTEKKIRTTKAGFLEKI